MTEPKPDWLYNQSAAIPYRYTEGQIRIALISSRSGRRWVIPKGVIDPGETAAGTAGREALEEAGLAGRLSQRPIGRYTYRKWGGTCRVQVFLLAVERALERWDESDFRVRQWMAVGEAAAHVREGDLQELIRRVPSLVGRPSS